MPRPCSSAMLRLMKAHEKGTIEVEGEAERLEGCAQVLATLDPRWGSFGWLVGWSNIYDYTLVSNVPRRECY